MLRALTLAIVSLAAAAVLAIPVLAAPSAQTVRGNEVSYRISLSAKPKAGLVKFVVRNAGDDPHDFWVKGGGKRWKTRVLGEAGSASLTARLRRASSTRTGAASATTPPKACGAASSHASSRSKRGRGGGPRLSPGTASIFRARASSL